MFRLPWCLGSKESTCNAGDMGSIPGSGRSPWRGNGNTPQYSCQENPMDRGAWWPTVHGVTKSRTRLSSSSNQCSWERWGCEMGIYTHIEIRTEYNKRGEHGQKMGVVWGEGWDQSFHLRDEWSNSWWDSLETWAFYPSAHDHYMTVPDTSRHKVATSLDADLLYKVKCPNG